MHERRAQLHALLVPCEQRLDLRVGALHETQAFEPLRGALAGGLPPHAVQVAVTVSEVHGDGRRLLLYDKIDSDLVLRAAMAEGRVTEFAFDWRRLSEVFREAMA